MSVPICVAPTFHAKVNQIELTVPILSSWLSTYPWTRLEAWNQAGAMVISDGDSMRTVLQCVDLLASYAGGDGEGALGSLIKFASSSTNPYMLSGCNSGSVLGCNPLSTGVVTQGLACGPGGCVPTPVFVASQSTTGATHELAAATKQPPYSGPQYYLSDPNATSKPKLSAQNLQRAVNVAPFLSKEALKETFDSMAKAEEVTQKIDTVLSRSRVGASTGVSTIITPN